MNKKRFAAAIAVIQLCICIGGCSFQNAAGMVNGGKTAEAAAVNVSEVPEYAGDPYVELNGNIPDFSESDLTEQSCEFYSELDQYGRCGTAAASIGTDLMPTEPREKIGSVKPSGWQTVKYAGIVEGNYLYNRCHLIGFQLTAENANEKNLITGTRYLNVEGMLPFENMVADYIKETGNHVLYRVTPVFEGSNLVASGVTIEAESVEDQGDGILFYVYCYNVQPGIEIDYRTGDSRIAESQSADSEKTDGNTAAETYIVNTNTGKFHRETCSSVSRIKEENRMDVSETREALLAEGYEPCGNCKP